MRTDDLIDALSVGLEPTRPARLMPGLLVAAGVTAVAAVVLILGVRPDLSQGLATAAPWLKLLYTLSLAAAALNLATRLGRPGSSLGPALVALVAIISVAMIWGVIELLMTPAGERLSDWLGRTWTVCGRNILIVSACAASFVFLSTRRLAPTRPMLAGGALGLATGGIAAAAYGVLHCPEATAAFVGTWYTLGMLAAGVIGTVIGRWALRW